MHRISLIVLLAIAFVPRTLFGQIEKDKVYHFGAGMIAGAGGAFLASELSGHDRLWTFTGAVGASLLAGLAKEAIDEKNYGGWDNGDLAATVLGGVTIGVTIDLFTARKRRRGMRFSLGAPPPHFQTAEVLPQWGQSH
jgi:asparagine N-glycosylation enzyme membrane subunit Stt3